MSAVKAPVLKARNFITDPQAIRMQLDMLYGIRNINLQMVTRTSANSLSPGISQIIGTPPNLVLPIPMLLDAGIADNDGTLASVASKQNQLFAAMRRRGDLPL